MSFYLFFTMTTVIAISYWLEEHTKWIAHISGVILIMIVASILSNSGMIPSSEDAYAWQFKWVVPFGIILMLLAFDPKNIFKVNKKFILCFIIGSISTAIGGVTAGIIFQKVLPQDSWYISGQLTASFIGGYENAVSVGAGLNTPISVFVSVLTGDSILTMLWIMINIYQGRKIKNKEGDKCEKFDLEINGNSMDITSISIIIAVASMVLAASFYLHEHIPVMPQILLAGIIATLITFTPLKNRLLGSYVFGSFILSFFIFGCGAITNISSVIGNPDILILFPLTIVAIHAIILFTCGKLLNIDKEIVIITSQCLIGGPATALAVLSARKWNYQFEAIALGFLGYAVGNYFGFSVAWIVNYLQ